jgi:spermidine synthase
LRRAASASARRKPLTIIAAVALIASATMLWQADAYLARMWPVKYSGLEWTVEDSVGSMFGTVKVLKSTPVDASGRFVRVYFQDGLIQNRMYSDGQPYTYYTFALEALSLSYRPDMRSALVLGLGAGVVPARLAARGVDVTAVEIDPASFAVARRYFGLDTSKFRALQADARTYLRSCDGAYDLVVVDLFHGDGTPDYLITRDFFADLRRCLTGQGVVVFNTFADLQFTAGYAHFLATLRAEFPFVTLYRQDEPGARHLNSFVVAAVDVRTARGVSIKDVPAQYAQELTRMLSRPRQLDPALLAGGQVITDARSAAARDIARTQMGYRSQVARDLPAAFLLN